MRAAGLAAVALAGLVLAGLVLAAAGPPEGRERALPEGGRLPVSVEPVTLTGGEFSGIEPAGAWALWSPHPRFGGLSGLLVEGEPAGVRILAVSDQGWWFGGRFVAARDGHRLEDARLAPMRDPGGETYDKAGGDAEGLTRLGARLAVAFERDHRIMWLRDTGRLGGTVRDRAFEELPTNKGIEALASLSDGRLLALAESRAEDGVRLFLIDPEAPDAPEDEAAAQRLVEARLAIPGRHAVTGADVGPDGRLYLVLRDFSMVLGLSIRVMRYRLGEDGLPVADSAETLAAFEQGSGIDNMEGIAVEAAPEGGLRLWLLSDDNFNPLQRTLLLRFRVTG